MSTDAYVDAVAMALGLEIPADCRAGVSRYWQLVASMAPRVMEFALDPVDESGNVFVPVEPRE